MFPVARVILLANSSIRIISFGKEFYS